MSEIKVNSIKGVGASTAAITVNNSDGTCTANITNNLSNRRLTINGAMTIAQRGDVSSVTSGYGGADRFKFDSSGAAVVTLKQDTGDITQGFAKAQRIDVTTADSSLAASDYALLSYRFEGQDLQQLKKGTDNAQQVTLSFHIKSPKTGTHIVELVDQSNSGRHVNKAYTVNVADTWEKKTVTFPMETSNAITNDNARRMDLNWWLAAGSTYSSGTLQTNWGSDTDANRAVGQVNCMDSTSNDIYITGVQLEVSDHATSFEFLNFADELRRCQRYFQLHNNIMTAGYVPDNNARVYSLGFNFPIQMRSAPSLSITQTGSTSHQAVVDGSAGANITSILSSNFSKFCAEYSVNLDADLTNFRPAITEGAGSSTRGTDYKFSAEL
tara:strand:- start:1409 stop:2557 length:1149 start_codon:yes stop_codon:yes gene_type:complete